MVLLAVSWWPALSVTVSVTVTGRKAGKTRVALALVALAIDTSGSAFHW
jgi:uncharacterized membrane protein YwzB